MSNWIKVEDRLPSHSGEFIINTKNGVDLGRFYQNTKEWKTVDRPIQNGYEKQVFRADL